METTKTLRKYVTPSIGVLDIRIERGFGTLSRAAP